MMKKLLLTGIVALFLTTGAAHAEPFPKEMLGKWCPVDESFSATFAEYKRDPNCTGDEIVIDRKGYDTGQEWTCKWTHWQSYGGSKKFDARYYYTIDCKGEGGATTEWGRLGLNGSGYLVIETTGCKGKPRQSRMNWGKGAEVTECTTIADKRHLRGRARDKFLYECENSL